MWNYHLSSQSYHLSSQSYHLSSQSYHLSRQTISQLCAALQSSSDMRLIRFRELRSTAMIGSGPSRRVSFITICVAEPSETRWPTEMKRCLSWSSSTSMALHHSRPDRPRTPTVSPATRSCARSCSSTSPWCSPSTSKKLFAQPTAGRSSSTPRWQAQPHWCLCSTPFPSTSTTCGHSSGRVVRRRRKSSSVGGSSRKARKPGTYSSFRTTQRQSSQSTLPPFTLQTTRPALAPFWQRPEKLTSTAATSSSYDRFHSKASVSMILLLMKACSRDHRSRFSAGILARFSWQSASIQRIIWDS